MRQNIQKLDVLEFVTDIIKQRYLYILGWGKSNFGFSQYMTLKSHISSNTYSMEPYYSAFER